MATATSNFMKEFFNGGFAPEFSVSLLKDTIALVRDYYVSETRKWEAKLAEKYICKRNLKSFSNERLIFFLWKVHFLLHFGSCQKSFQKSCQKCITQVFFSLSKGLFFDYYYYLVFSINLKTLLQFLKIVLFPLSNFRWTTWLIRHLPYPLPVKD